MKKFFGSMEEKFVFPIGRRTWQILSLLALLILTCSTIYFLYNSTPTKRENVSISKNEVIENKIDTTSKFEKITESCEINDYQSWIDTLKSDLPNSEWSKLSDLSEPHIAYVIDEFGNYKTDEYGNYLTELKRDTIPNPKAIPVLLNDIYSSKGLDTNSICDKIQILKTLHALNTLTYKPYLQNEAIFIYIDFLKRTNWIDPELIKISGIIYFAVESKNLNITDNNTLQKYGKYLDFLKEHKPETSVIESVKSLLDEHRKLKNPIFKNDDYLDVAKVVFETALPQSEITNAVNEFNEEIDFYDKNGFLNSLKKYLKLYQEKLERAEQEQSLRKERKALNRSMSLIAAGTAFVSIVSIATILLLFSIQSILKIHLTKKE